MAMYKPKQLKLLTEQRRHELELEKAAREEENRRAREARAKTLRRLKTTVTKLIRELCEAASEDLDFVFTDKLDLEIETEISNQGFLVRSVQKECAWRQEQMGNTEYSSQKHRKEVSKAINSCLELVVSYAENHYLPKQPRNYIEQLISPIRDHTELLLQANKWKDLDEIFKSIQSHGYTLTTLRDMFKTVKVQTLEHNRFFELELVTSFIVTLKSQAGKVSGLLRGAVNAIEELERQRARDLKFLKQAAFCGHKSVVVFGGPLPNIPTALINAELLSWFISNPGRRFIKYVNDSCADAADSGEISVEINIDGYLFAGNSPTCEQILEFLKLIGFGVSVRSSHLEITWGK